MPPTLVLDTSVIIKWFRQGEVLASQALALRTAYLEGKVFVAAPMLAAYELANALRYKDDLTTAQVEEAVQSLFDLGLNWVPPSADVMRRAVAIAREYETTVYDATFAAVAEFSGATFVTADEQLAQKLGPFPFVRFLGN